MEVGLSPGDFVLDGDPVRLPEKESSPQFLAHVYCGKPAASIKMPLGTAVGLSLCDIVLDRDLASPLLKGLSSPIFRQRPFVAMRLDGLICHLVWW